jgi:programmed cell death 6-interacting protein
LNLPAALEDICNEQELPESIREKSARVKSLGGIQSIQQMIGELPGLLKRNHEIIDEVS